jgi:hypothetical protein
MKCQEFQSNMEGFARGALLEARTRDEAAAHEESCAVCASRLADERALTAGLRALAATMLEKETPARAEAALLAAFRSRATSTQAATPRVTSTRAATPNVVTTAAPSSPNAPSNVVSLSEHAGAKHWSWVKTVAVAAMAAAAVALFMLVPPYLSTPPPPPGQTASNNIRSAPPLTHKDATTNSEQNTTAQSGGVQVPSTAVGEVSMAPKDVNEGVTPSTPTPKRNVVRAMNASYGNTPRVGVPNRGEPVEVAGAGEITTEFIPLVQYAGFAQSEGAHLVRVELPRSALASFGIPVNADQAGGRVKADVLLGEDGTARAIRFVR